MNGRMWTESEISRLIEIYPDHTGKEVAEKLGRKLTSVYGKAKTLGLCKSEEFKRSDKSGRLNKTNQAGIGHRFKKGHTPANKGRKVSSETRARMAKTFFKKGQLPHNTLSDGAIRTRRDRRGIPYQFIRISAGKWEHLHRHMYRTKIGEIPDMMVVIFKDGNTMNCTVENLGLITKQQNMKRNTIHQYPEDVKQGIRALSKLKKKIKHYEKQD